MNKIRYRVWRVLIIFVLCLVCTGFNGCLTAAPRSRAEMVKKIDAFLSGKYSANKPGIAVLVVNAFQNSER